MRAGLIASLCLAFLFGLADGLVAETIYVSASAEGQDDGTSWFDAHTDLQDALLRAQAGDEIWVAAGTYVPRNVDNPENPQAGRFALPGAVEVLGGFDGTEATLAERAGLFDETILSGDVNGDDEPNFALRDDNTRVVVRSQFDGAVLDGFTVRGSGPVGNGGLLVTGGSLIVRNVTFVDNLARASGAGAAVSLGSVAFMDCAFLANRLVDGGSGYRVGAGLAIDEGNVTVSGCLFEGNDATAGNYGGGLGLADVVGRAGNPPRQTVLIEDCVFRDNLAGGGGGAIGVRSTRVAGLDLTIRDTSCEGNRVDFGGGGAIFFVRAFPIDGEGQTVERTSLTLERVSLRHNTALVAQSGLPAAGGGMWTNAQFPVDVVLRDSMIVGNYAGFSTSSLEPTRGAGLVVQANSIDMSGCVVADNVAECDLGEGGGAYLLAFSFGELRIHDSAFVGNRMHKRDRPNALTGMGGGVYAFGRVSFSNVALAGNLSETNGGGYISTAAGTYSGLTVAGNRARVAEGGLRIDHLQAIRLRNSVLWNNLVGPASGPSAERQLHGAPTGFLLLNCNIQNLPPVYGGSNNVDVDPRFVDALGPDGLPATGDENFRLQFNSPCVDAGDNSLVPADAFDVDGDGDANEPMPFDVDGNLRQVDQRLHPDTGVGAAPIVDMGAYEYAVPCPGDLDGDGVIDMSDLAMLLGGYGSVSSDAGFVAVADIRGDGRIDLSDLAALLSVFGESCL